MKKITQTRNKVAGSKAFKPVSVIGQDKRGLREYWRIASENQTKTISTTPSSSAAMDEAVKVYDSALKSLANR
jgi:hypothetical protein